MPGGKAKVPEYPRPVSPVSAEEYPICHDTIVYDEGDESLEDSTDQRAAKRRRIESYATAYLRGEPLFILSAQLKGPFGEGWRNPWRRKGGRRAEKDMAQLEVPETTVKPQPRFSAGSAHHGSGASSSHSTPIYRVKQPIKQTLISNKTNVITPVLPIDSAAPTFASYAGAPSSKNKQVEDWLKKSKGYSQAKEHESPSSPTPLIRSANVRTKKWESPAINVEFPPVPDNIVSLAALPSLQPTNASELGAIIPTTRKPEAQPSQAISTGAGTVQPILVAKPQQTQDVPPVVAGRPKTASEDHSRPETAILAVKRRSLHTIPPSSHLPAFEYCRVATREAAQDARPRAEADGPHKPSLVQTAEFSACPDAGIPTNSNEPSESLHTAEEGLSPGLVELTSASPGKVHSRPSTVHDIPSAQMPVQTALESAPSNLSGTVAMLEEPREERVQGVDHNPLSHVLHDVTQPAQGGQPSEFSVAQEHGLDKNTPIQPVHLPVSLSLPSEVTPKPKTTKPSDTQEMIESITPFEFSTIKKTRTLTTHDNSTPRTATKTRAMSKRKRASFAPEDVSSGSSGGSLKAVMKVAKSTSMHLDTASSIKNIGDNEDEDENSILNSIHHIPTNTQGSHFGETAVKNGARRGILKSSVNPSAPALTSGTNNTSSSIKQDAQRVRALDVIESEIELPQDDFDVDAVMDDLGSYLGTWDAEKEALEFGEARG